MVQAAFSPVGPTLGDAIPGFGTDGIRGRVGSVVTPALCLQVGYWVGRVLAVEGPVLIGMDSRTSGSMVASALTAGLTAAGREVWNLGLCPTPAVPLLIRKFGAAGGLMVSASHNPPPDNGIKVFGANGAKLAPERQARIEAGLRGEIDHSDHDHSLCAGLRQSSDLMADYRELLLSAVGSHRLDGVPIVLDLCWGSATACAADAFQALGADLTVLHGEPDGSRINVGCGSTALGPLQEAVKERGAVMGFAFDGDADRMLAVDGRGRIVDGDHVMFLWGSVLQEQQALPDQRLVATVMSNLGFQRAWEQRGGILERTPVGDQHVHAAMVASGAALGGEQSGHILAASHGLCGDGVLTALQLSTLCHAKGITLGDWLDRSFQPFPQKLVNVTVPSQARRKAWSSCEPLVAAIRSAEETMGSDGRVLVRASGTEPLVRVMVEAADASLVEHWADHLASVVDQSLNAA
jgi:phosphoglucosamine mutase